MGLYITLAVQLHVPTVCVAYAGLGKPPPETSCTLSEACCFATISAPAQIIGPPPQAPVQLPVFTNVQPEASYFTAVIPQYNFSYGPDPQQPDLFASGLWSFYMPIQVTNTTPGWTTGEYGIGGLEDTFYEVLSGPILRNGAAIGSVYQSASEQVPGSERKLAGFAAICRVESERLYISTQLDRRDISLSAILAIPATLNTATHTITITTRL